jgi:hypothetical protein
MKNWFEKNRLLLFLALIVLLVAVKSWFYFSKQEVNMSFYHWKKNINLTDKEEDILLKNKQSPLYLHYFDVDWDEDKNFIVPIAVTTSEKALVENTLVIPVIYISNHVFETVPDSQMTHIAETIWKRTAFISSRYEADMGIQIAGLQIDCDWTLQTKDKYFAFLKALDDLCTMDLSATIRLHQIKYSAQTGVPPVSRGMLMFYNMGDLDNPNTQNSILDLETAKKYVSFCKDYPLGLDVALPLFQWAVVIRDGKVVQLLNAASLSDYSDTDYFEKIGDLQVKVKDSTYSHGFYCYEGDIIRIENVTQQQLEAAAKMLSGYLPSGRRTVCFYHLDFEILQANPYENLEKIRTCLE